MLYTIIFLLAMQIKHLICDFFLQTPFQYLNKGTYGHPGGILHTGIHLIASFLILFVFAALGMFTQDNQHRLLFLGILAGEGLIHYHMDWAKVQINRWKGWLPNNSPYFWYLLGVDQFVHNITYLGMAYVWLK